MHIRQAFFTGSVFMKDRFLNRLKIPVIGMLIFTACVLCFSLTSSLRLSADDSDGGMLLVSAIDAASEIIAHEKTEYTIITTTTTTTSTTTTTTTTTASPYEICIPTKYTGNSPNSAFYQERLAVAGDSLALGFCYYGFIPDMHNIAGDSVSMWNLDYFTFNYGNGELGMVDAIDFIHPRLLYMSLGMNDVNLNYPDSFTERYRAVLEEIIKRDPEINIVVAAITPVCSYCNVVRNDIIRDYNAALKKMVEDMDSPQICFFDAYSLVCNEALELRSDYTSGDGMHLYIPCYNDLLTALFDFLDTTDFKQRLGG